MADQLKTGFIPTPTYVREGLVNLTYSFVTECPDVAWIRDDMVLTDPYGLAAGYRPITVAHPDISQAVALGAGVVLDIAQ